MQIRLTIPVVNSISGNPFPVTPIYAGPKVTEISERAVTSSLVTASHKVRII